MSVRALIVVLIVLNAGVALWWAVQLPTAPPPAPPQPTGVARLELLPVRSGAGGTALSGAAPKTGLASAAGRGPTATVPAALTSVAAPVSPSDSALVAGTPTPTSASATADATTVVEAPRSTHRTSATAKASANPAESITAASATPSPTTPSSERCASLGPFAARADAVAALARVRGQASRANVREDKDAGISTFRVMLLNVGDRAAAQALVKRIAAAGIGDYYVIAQGEDSTVALGQYQSRERAERRQASLVSAGFPAQLVPSGSGQSRWWIDVRSSAATSDLRGAAGAVRQRSLDCAALR